jgi:hypothetical protein
MERVVKQIQSFMQNSEVSMTKEQYFEMCEMLNSEPSDDEIPVEFDDLPLEVQEAYLVYNRISDNWDSMSGTYLGKNLVGIKDIFEIYGIEDARLTLQLISNIDNIRRDAISKKKATKSQPAV